ncbi:MAG: DegT/DnrJ/EryC1/StrS aminotransferase family protein [Oscillospiraceae bacterium]|nr:DegT/DnrJ/EryC1/StrS aminotransferase family protein [Oscillospiraceae bacterium]
MAKKTDLIPLSVPNLIGHEIKYVVDAMKSGWISAGECIRKFEKTIATYIKIENAVACQSGTAALHLALLALGVQNNDEVVISTISFIASVNPIKYVGAHPVFIDCDDSLCMDAEKLEDFIKEKCFFDGKILINKLTSRRIKAVLVVYIFGNVPNLEKILDLSKKYNFKIIEDAAEALGTYYKEGSLKGMFIGAIGDVGIFSFNANKIITTSSGGIVVSKDEKIMSKAKLLSMQSKDSSIYFIHNNIGYNYQMTNLQAAIGLAQFENLEKFIKIKNDNYKLYEEQGVKLLSFNPNIRSNKWMYSFLTSKRDEIIQHLKEHSIESRPIWKPMHLQKSYQESFCYKIEKALFYWKQIVNLPCSTNLTSENVKKTSKLVTAF